MPASNAKLIRIKGATALSDHLDVAIQAFLDYSKAKNLSRRTIEFYEARFLAFTKYVAENEPGIAAKGITPAFIRDFIAASKITYQLLPQITTGMCYAISSTFL